MTDAGAMRCEACGDPVDPQTGYRKVTGYERIKRGQGGTNAIRLREVTEEFRCMFCVDSATRGLTGQGSLM